MNTTYFLNCVAGNLFKQKGDPALPTEYYIGLSSTPPSTSGSGDTEPSGNGYERVKLEHLSDPTEGVVTNEQAINFPESTASWGTITHFVIYDQSSGGNLLMYGELTTPRSVEAATIMTIKENYLKLSAQNPTE